MSAPSPVLGEALRKLVALGLAVGLTFLMVRVFERLAHGRLGWDEPALWALLVLGLLALWWARSTVRVRPPRPGEREPD